MKRPSYRSAIEYIALNDAPGDEPDVEEMTGFISVGLVSEIFDVPQEKVAQDVWNYRKKEARLGS